MSWIFIKPYYAYRVVSIYEFLEIRFGATTRQAASAIFLITRALASQSRTIRLPVHITEKLNRIKRAQRELSARLGRLPCVAEIAQELNLSEALIRETLLQLPKPVSLEARVGKEQDMQLGDLLEDGHGTPEQELAREQLHNDLEALLEDLSSREAEVIRQRFGLVDDTPRSLTEIGAAMQLSRERVRQVELKALRKLRHFTRRSPSLQGP